MSVLKFVAHSKNVLRIAHKHGWLPGARYTNLRDIKTFDKIGFLDIDWKKYNFGQHLNATIETKPIMTVAQDIIKIEKLDEILNQAEKLSDYCEYVVLVPKDLRLSDSLCELIPDKYILGYSVPTKYGGTKISPDKFRRPVHLLGGRPDIQRKLANQMPVVSFDCNRFTIDASFGDYFDGEIFRPHPTGGYINCIEDSLKNINKLWSFYTVTSEFEFLSKNGGTINA